MEILRGEDLNSILERDGPLKEGEVIKVAVAVQKILILVLNLLRGDVSHP